MSSAETATSSSPAAAAPASPGKDGPTLLEALRKQVEYYFSRENLANDPFLVGQMNSQLYVPLAVILEFSKVKALTTDPALVVEALQSSTQCTLDDTKTMIKPNISAQRNTIILREIPSSTPEEEVRALFDAEGCGKPTSVRSVHDTWFVTVEDEETAMNTILALRRVKFNGQTVKARLKSENLLRGLMAAPGDGAASPAAPGGPAHSGGALPGAMTFPPGTAAGARLAGAPMFAAPHMGSFLPTPGAFMFPGASFGRMPMGQFSVPAGAPVASARSGKASPPRAGAKPAGGRAAVVGVKGTSQQPQQQQQQPHKGVPISQHFPPLGEPVLPGYQKPFKKFTAQQMIEIIKAMPHASVTRPEGLSAEAHPHAVSAAPNMDLVRKQRSESMDAAFRHGRPRLDSVDSVNSVDYASMMFGESERELSRRRKGSNAASRGSGSHSSAAGGGRRGGAKSVEGGKNARGGAAAASGGNSAARGAAKGGKQSGQPASAAAAAPASTAATAAAPAPAPANAPRAPAETAAGKVSGQASAAAAATGYAAAVMKPAPPRPPAAQRPPAKADAAAAPSSASGSTKSGGRGGGRKGGRNSGQGKGPTVVVNGEAKGRSAGSKPSAPAVTITSPAGATRAAAAPSAPGSRASQSAASEGPKPRRGWEKPGLPPVAPTIGTGKPKAAPSAGDGEGSTPSPSDSPTTGETSSSSGGASSSQARSSKGSTKASSAGSSASTATSAAAAPAASGPSAADASASKQTASAPAPAPASAKPVWGAKSGAAASGPSFAEVLRKKAAAAPAPAPGAQAAAAAASSASAGRTTIRLNGRREGDEGSFRDFSAMKPTEAESAGRGRRSEAFRSRRHDKDEA